MPEPHRAREASRLAPLLTVAAAAVLAVACAGSSTPSSTPPATTGATPAATPEPTASATPSVEPTISTPPQPGSQEVTPSSPPKDVGAVEELTLFTHCGLLPGRVDWAGSFWAETSRAPTGGPIGDPEDSGRMTLINETTARFEASTGTVVVLERVDGPVTIQPCD